MTGSTTGQCISGLVGDQYSRYCGFSLGPTSIQGAMDQPVCGKIFRMLCCLLPFSFSKVLFDKQKLFCHREHATLKSAFEVVA